MSCQLCGCPESRRAAMPTCLLRLQNATAAEARATEFEIAALAECAHAHVVRMYATSRVGRETYIALERCEGSLMRLVTGDVRPAEAEVARMMRQVWDVARAAAHGTRVATALKSTLELT